MASENRRRTLDRLSDYSDAALLLELARIAKQLDRNSLTVQDIEEHGRCCYATIKNRFGGLKNALRACGLSDERFNRNISDDELLKELARVWDLVLAKEGRRPYQCDLMTYGSKFSRGPYLRRWGSWIRACEALLDWEPPSTDVRVEVSQSLKAAQPARKRPIPLRIRYAILLRDNFVCQVCGRSPASNPGLEIHVDHIMSESNGGTLEPSNLRCLCADCNLGKGPTSERQKPEGFGYEHRGGSA